jgi:hypothetical protein
MPQISLYIDEQTLKKIEIAARIEDVSLSKWVNGKLKSVLQRSWPQGYFELCGALTDGSFRRHESDAPSRDNQRSGK